MLLFSINNLLKYKQFILREDGKVETMPFLKRFSLSEWVVEKGRDPVVHSSDSSQGMGEAKARSQEVREGLSTLISQELGPTSAVCPDGINRKLDQKEYVSFHCHKPKIARHLKSHWRSLFQERRWLRSAEWKEGEKEQRECILYLSGAGSGSMGPLGTGELTVRATGRPWGRRSLCFWGLMRIQELT